MDEWWTYTLSDLLLFSPRTYYRMLERHNEAFWPRQIITLGLGVGIFGLLWLPARWQGRVISTLVAGVWAWVGWSFLWKRYATINWAAEYFAWLFAIEVLLMVWIGVIQGRLSYRPTRDVVGIVGVALLALGLVFYPMIAPLSGRPWEQAESFGVFPDPTAIVTIGLALLVDGSPRWKLLIVPLLWCAIAGATLCAMGSAEASVVAATAILVLAVIARPPRHKGEHDA